MHETIKDIVPEKQWLKKNGQVVSVTTKELFEKRAKEFKRAKPTSGQRKKWNAIRKLAVRRQKDHAMPPGGNRTTAERRQHDRRRTEAEELDEAGKELGDCATLTSWPE